MWQKNYRVYLYRYRVIELFYSIIFQLKVNWVRNYWAITMKQLIL